MSRRTRPQTAVLCVIAALAIVPTVTARRRVTPNTTAATTTQSVNELAGLKAAGDSTLPANVVPANDSQGNVIYVDTISGTEWIDSAAIRTVPRMTQPLLYSASVGVNIWDPVMRLFGQQYGLVDFSAEINLHNRYIPVFEFGLGRAGTTPDNANYTYSSPMAPYFKIGCNYNFLYNSNPRYMVYAGARYGWTSFKYSLDNVSLAGDYWGTESNFSIPSQTASVGYMELMFGIRVGIAANISLGWAFKYHTALHGLKGHEYGDPWYIPGYGTNGSSVTGAFTITYTIPLNKGKTDVAATQSNSGG